MISLTTLNRAANKHYAAVEIDTKNLWVKVWLNADLRWACNGERFLSVKFEDYHSKAILINLYTKLIKDMEKGTIER